MHNNDPGAERLVVLVTQRVDYIQDYGETRDALDQRLMEWLTYAGLASFPVPNSLIYGDLMKRGMDEKQRYLTEWGQRLSPDALVLSGGNNIGQFARRDLTEGYLLDWAEKHRVPVLGICRGMQFMVKWAGGELVEVAHHVGIRHSLEKMMDQEILPDEVNSYHNWGLRECPSQFKVMARTEDGVIEAIRHDSLPWEGWMWHPERENPFIKEDIDRIKQLFKIKN